MPTDPTRLAEIEEIYESGRYLDAFAALNGIGGPLGIRDAPGMVLAARIMGNLGALRLARLLYIRAHRLDRRDPLAAYYFSSALADMSGPLAAATFVRGFKVPEDAAVEPRALLLLQLASSVARLRDFEEADRLWREAAAMWEHPWLWVERSMQLAASDAWSGALAATEKALAMHPRYRPALQQMASLLTSNGESARAERFLTERNEGMQAPYLLLQIANLRADLDRPREARDALAAAVEMMPWPEAETVQSLSSLAANIHFKLGDVGAAVQFGRMVGSPAHLRLAARLERKLPPRRLLLEVPYVRQDHKTCAPATLTSLCQFHRLAADQVSIVEEICYDGTPAATERRWVESHGMIARHFTVTWDAAVALLERGLPFALLTVDATSSHLQAIAGYDVGRGTFLVRDPSMSGLVEMDAAGMLEQQAFAGPQGMVLVPHAQAGKLEGLPLPDAELHDALYRLQRALLAHRREAAETELAALRSAAPDSVVTLAGERALASYDGNQAALLVVFDRVLAAYPRATPALYGRLSCLENLARDEQRRAALAEAAARPDADSLFGRMYAEELARDGRYRDKAELWLRSSIRRRPHDAAAYALLGDLAARENDFARAYALARVATCIEDMNEGLALRYFMASRMVRRQEEGLTFLRRRVERLGKRAAGPWQTLHTALVQLDRLKEAEQVLADAAAARPDDGDLFAIRAWAALRRGRLDEARRLADGARGRVKEAEFARLAGEIDRLSGDRRSAIARWRSVLATDPLSLEAHAAVTRLLVESGDRAAGLEHLHEAWARHPHHAGLARLAVEFTEPEGEEGLAVVRRLVALAPTDAWARRELTDRLARLHRIDEALQEVDEAVSLDPAAAATHGVRGYVLAGAGRREAAREAYRTALSHAADYVFAFQALLQEENDVADRLRAIRFLQAELRRQVVFGDALPAWRAAARGLLPDEEVLAFLEEARAARPDLLGAWETVIEQLAEMGRMDDARAQAREATEKFPLVVEPLLRLAAIEDRRGDGAARRDTLRRALEIEPGNVRVSRQLADALADAGDVDGALALLEAACERSPLDASNHGLLADVLARAGRLSEAVARARRALEVEPAYDWLWEAMVRWARSNDLHAAVIAVADAIVDARPDAAAAHLGRAFVLDARRGRELEALAAIERAIACEPRSLDAHDRYAQMLAELRRFDEALAACRPAVFGETPPIPLRGRRAWVLAQKGVLAEAAEEMEVVVAENPSYLWGFLRLGAWYDATRSPPQARRAFERALLLSPGMPEAALGLFDACLALRDHDGCRRALDALHGETDPTFVAAREVQLACALGQRQEGLAEFERLCALRQSSDRQIVEAARALGAQGMHRKVRKILERAVVNPERDDADALGLAWAKIVAAGDDLALLTGARRLIAASRAGQAAIAAQVETLANESRRAPLFLLWLVAREALARATTVWGAFGYALVRAGWYRLALRWMRDHAARPDVEPWMLRDLVAALVWRGRGAEARAVSERALTLPPDHATDLHRRWLALHAALEGRQDEVTARLAGCVPEPGQVGQLLEDYARALVGAGVADRGRQRQAVDELEARSLGLVQSGDGLLVSRFVRRALRG